MMATTTEIAGSPSVSPNILGLDEGLRSQLVASLNQNLANLTDLAAAYDQAHWNVAGPSFTQLHELFDRFSNDVREYTDVVAERAVTLGGVAHGTLQAAAERSTLPPFPLEERNQWALVESLMLRTEHVAAALRAAMDLSADEAATEDVFIDVLRGIEKQHWMLRQHLA
ncbi:MAG: DNA starvation/stationary phase protection protein Dps [Chloroflexi bacterium]|nr:DNA starvation/stationary phase protection protein Dps [Chloroflexota bacterium]